MLKSLALVSLLVTAAARAQSSDPGQPAEQAPAPIVRSYQSTPTPQANPDQQGNQPRPGLNRTPMPRRLRRPESAPDQIIDSQPISGVWLRSRSSAVLKTVSATPRGTEVRLERGILNVNVHQPAVHSEILIDLPGGQTSLLKDGLYTFNADTNTVRVLHGQAAAYPGPITGPITGATSSERPIKVKEFHQLAFSSTAAHSPADVLTSSTPAPAPNSNFANAMRPNSVEAYPYELAADLLPASPGDGSGYASASGPGYAYGDDGPYGYPYPYYAGAWGYPYGSYPYGIGIGFGYGYYGGSRGYRGAYYARRPFLR